jgi:putative DNA primase/helicase
MNHHMTLQTPREVANALAVDIECLAESLLGKPTQRIGNELRYRGKGSLAVVIRGDKRGRFFDHERGQGGDALELVRQVNGGTFSDAMKWATDWLGLAPGQRPVAVATPSQSKPEPTDTERIDRALAIWADTVPLVGTLAEVYLKGRGITLEDEVADLRFHPRCPAGAGERLPAMVALMRNIATNEPSAIHRTFLRADGLGKADTGKRMLGVAAGAVIKIDDDAEVSMGLGLAEGIENALSLWSSGWRPVWAAGSAGAIKTFPVMDGIEALTIFADADDSGVGIEAARSCATRWSDAGRKVDIHKPPAGTDWNDVARRVAA